MGRRLTTAVFAIVQRDASRASPPFARRRDGCGAATHGGSLNRSTLWVSAKIWDGSYHDDAALDDMRCLLMAGNLTLSRFAIGDGVTGRSGVAV
jgi:hypothetical protein